MEDLTDGIIFADILTSVYQTNFEIFNYFFIRERPFFKSILESMKCLPYEPSIEVKHDNLKILYDAII